MGDIVMRHPSLIGILGLLLASCGGGNSTGTGDIAAAPQGLLRPVSNDAEFESRLKSALEKALAQGLPSGPVAMPTVDFGQFSTTYTAEAGVDELDVARYDGRLLFSAPGYTGAAGAPLRIRILQTQPAQGTAAEVGAITLPVEQFVLGMYATAGKLVVITSPATVHTFGDLWASILPWAPAKFTVRTYDVSDPERPAEMMMAAVDGVFVASRRIDGRVFIVTRYAPAALLDATKRAQVGSLPLAELLPQLTLLGRAGRSLVDPRDCYVASGTQAPAPSPVITTLLSFSIADPGDIESICYDEAASGVYASRTAVYVAEPRSDAGRELTRIHKFALGAAQPRYAGSAEIEGAVWLGGQSDFRMSEADGDLRVFTTQFTGDAADDVDHRLFVLRAQQRDGRVELETIGSLPNASRPEEIGKPGERLYGVRFAGDRAYAITFRRVDPLYVIDLSAPADPRIAGSLELPGFSDFLHPVADGLLLGIGSDANRVKVELFDVSDLAQPQSRGALVVDGLNSWSEAQYDRHAFAWLPGAVTDRFAIPVTALRVDASGNQQTTTSLQQFEIAGKEQPSGAFLRDAGAVTPVTSGSAQWASTNRAFIGGDVVYWVRDTAVWSSDWTAPATVRGPF